MNRQHSQQHPEPQILADYLQGKLSEEQSTTVETHIECCETCCEKLAFVDDDPFTDLAKKAGQEFSLDSDLPQDSLFDLDFSPKEEQAIIDSIDQNKRYQIVKKIGSGGMGNVYHARHLLMNRDVALKVIHPKWTDRQHAIARFRKEVQSLAKLNHKNIVASFDAEQINGTHFLVMELIEGKSAFQMVQEQGPLNPQKSLDIIKEVAFGLQAAQQASLVHRDIKPQNIMLQNDGGVKILDFGLIRLRTELSDRNESSSSDHSFSHPGLNPELTGTHIALGTPDYLAPEQAKDAATADVRSDIYSLGCTLYFLLTGEPPFRGTDAYKTIGNHLSADPPNLQKTAMNVPLSVKTLAERMIEKSPALRFQTPEELISAIDQILPETRTADQPISQSIEARSSKLTEANTRRNFIFAIGTGVLAAAGIFFASNASFGLLDRTTKKVLIVCPKQTYYPDFLPVAKQLKEGGIEVQIACLSNTVHPVLPNQGKPIPADLRLEQVESDDFDAVVFVGGNMQFLVDNSVTSQHAKTLIHKFLKNDKLVTGICAGVEVLKQAGLQTIDPSDDASTIFQSEQVITASSCDQAVDFAKQISIRLHDR